jgi:hypothetical protein
MAAPRLNASSSRNESTVCLSIIHGSENMRGLKATTSGRNARIVQRFRTAQGIADGAELWWLEQIIPRRPWPLSSPFR